MKPVRGRILLLVLVTVASIILSIPSWPDFVRQLPDGLQKVLPGRGVSLGLDLQGGIHLVLEVEEDRAVEIAIDRMAKAIQDALTDQEIPFESVERKEGTQLHLILSEETKAEDADQIVKDGFPAFLQESQNGTSLVYTLRGTEVDRIKNSAMNQALETIRNRIDQFGVAEPLIQRQDRTQIVVQLPGIKDPQRAKALIQETALLEFKMLNETSDLRLEFPSQVDRAEESTVLKRIC